MKLGDFVYSRDSIVVSSKSTAPVNKAVRVIDCRVGKWSLLP